MACSRSIVNPIRRNVQSSVQAQFLSENCILVDERDNIIGQSTKGVCHKWKNIETGDFLHRAFSVFLFDNNRLLLQKRSSEKITFPNVWTNTCCSHPLYCNDEIENSSNAIGVRRAAHRKLKHELGFTSDEVPIDSMDWISRILYKAPSNDDWGEHEMDYVIFIQSNDIPKPNPSEVSDIRYVNQNQLIEMMDQSKRDTGIVFSPWFMLIAESFLFKWWDNLDNLDNIKDWKNIHNFS